VRINRIMHEEIKCLQHKRFSQSLCITSLMRSGFFASRCKRFNALSIEAEDQSRAGLRQHFLKLDTVFFVALVYSG
jgi:hypothetical protein